MLRSNDVLNTLKFSGKKGTKRWEKTSPPQRWLTQGGLDCPINQEQISVNPKNGWPNTPNMGKAVMVHSGRQRIGYYPTTRHPIKLFIQASLAPPPPQKSHHSSSVLSPLAASECPTSLVNRSLFPRVWEREREVFITANHLALCVETLAMSLAFPCMR